MHREPAPGSDGPHAEYGLDGFVHVLRPACAPGGPGVARVPVGSCCGLARRVTSALRRARSNARPRAIGDHEGVYHTDLAWLLLLETGQGLRLPCAVRPHEQVVDLVQKHVRVLRRLLGCRCAEGEACPVVEDPPTDAHAFHPVDQRLVLGERRLATQELHSVHNAVDLAAFYGVMFIERRAREHEQRTELGPTREKAELRTASELTGLFGANLVPMGALPNTVRQDMESLVSDPVVTLLDTLCTKDDQDVSWMQTEKDRSEYYAQARKDVRARRQLMLDMGLVAP